MKKQYKRDAYYLDDGILLHGYKDKYGFHPEYGIPCGFSRQILNKRDVGRVLFYSLPDAISKLGEVELAGGKFTFGIDNGMAVTKFAYVTGTFNGQYKTETLIVNNDVKPVVLECLSALGVKALRHVKIEYFLSSELPSQTLPYDKLRKFLHEVTLP